MPWDEPYWWASTSEARDAAAKDFDRTVGINHRTDEVPFEHTARMAATSWQPGTWGKGLTVAGQPHTWTTDRGGAPHHFDKLAEIFPEPMDPEDWEPGFHYDNAVVIAPDGSYTTDGPTTDPALFARLGLGMKYVPDSAKWQMRAFSRSSMHYDDAGNIVPIYTRQPDGTRVPYLIHPQSGERITGAPGGSIMQHVQQTLGLPDVQSVWNGNYEVGKDAGSGTIAKVASFSDQDVDQFLDGYMEAALWSSTDDKDQPLDANYGFQHIAPVTQDAMRQEAIQFLQNHEASIEQYLEAGHSLDQAGHDFWLTRNHHGVGFWDRGLPGSLGNDLTNASHSHGESDLYLGDDQYLHGSNYGDAYQQQALTQMADPQNWQHPDPWMDSEPGATTFPEGWARWGRGPRTRLATPATIAKMASDLSYDQLPIQDPGLETNLTDHGYDLATARFRPVTIPTPESGLDDSVGEDPYMQDLGAWSPHPPIVLSEDGELLDGSHRAWWAAKRGQPTMEAFQVYDPDDEADAAPAAGTLARVATLDGPSAEDNGYTPLSGGGDYYGGGGCYYLATAMHHAFGLPIAASYDRDGHLNHAWVHDGDQAYDAYGVHDPPEAPGWNWGGEMDMNHDPAELARRVGYDYDPAEPYGNQQVSDALDFAERHFTPRSS